MAGGGGVASKMKALVLRGEKNHRRARTVKRPIFRGPPSPHNRPIKKCLETIFIANFVYFLNFEVFFQKKQ